MPATAGPPSTPDAAARAESQPQARHRQRISFVIDRLAGLGGGAERVLVEIANALAGRGHQVEIVSHDALGTPPFYPLAAGVTHTNLRRPTADLGALRRTGERVQEALHRRVRRFPFPLDRMMWLSKHGAFQRRLERHLDRQRPDVAIAFLPPAITALGLARPRLAHPGLPPRRIATLHNVPEHDLASPGRWDPNPLDRRRRMEALANFDAITVLLPEFRDWFPEPLRARVFVVPNAVRPVPSAAIRAHERTKTVLSVGRLNPVKRHGLLIEAWALLADEFPDWTLKIFGMGPLAPELARTIAERQMDGKIRLMGQTGAIGAEYISAAILAHPAAHEGWGLAVTEALAAGVPAVAFADCPGVNQLIRHGENGLLVEPGPDPAASLAEALASLMRDEKLRSAMALAAPETMRVYAPGKVIDLWEALLWAT